jgi:endonuclease/exonuclease/phosphatase family metal-dependent hydrolase
MVPDALRLLTWNVGRLHLGARWNRLLGLDSRASNRALAHVARVIAEARADVAALQELADARQASRLAELLGDGWCGELAECSCDRHAALLVRRELAPEFCAVPSPGGRSMATARLERGAAAWRVASIHFDAYDDAAREAQARALIEWARAQPERAVVALGDLNLDPLHPSARARDGSTYRALASELCDLGAGAGATALLGRRVDYILGRFGVVGRVAVWRGRRVRLGDHDPVVAELRLAPGAQVQLRAASG